MKDRAKLFFVLADQYAEAAKLLFDALITGGNSNAGIGCTPEDAHKQMVQNMSKSDSFLFIPAMFNCLQSTELFAKGLLLLNGIEIDGTHDLQSILEKMQTKYDANSQIYKVFRAIHCSQKKILKEYRQQNKISNAQELYISLRYPENFTGKQYDYRKLMYNGDDGIKLFISICNAMSEVKRLVLNEYRHSCH